MSDTFKHNRDLLGKKKTARERQKDEIRIRSSSYENVNVDYGTARVSAKLKRNRGQEMAGAIIGTVLILCVVGGAVWIAYSTAYSFNKRPSEAYFNFILYRQRNGLVLKTDYYSGGPRAAETTLKDGKKHQNSESFYPTGEQFRSALYYYDTLVRETYFYKNGDTIKNFPIIPEGVVGHVTLHNIKIQKVVKFDFIDGKIIGGTYGESHLK